MNYCQDGPHREPNVCVYTHGVCHCGGMDKDCRKLAVEELTQSRDVLAKLGGLNRARELAANNPWWKAADITDKIDKAEETRKLLSELSRKYTDISGIAPDGMPPIDRTPKRWWKSPYIPDAIPITPAVTSSTPKPPAANTCPGCKRKIPDGKEYCGNRKCYPGPTSQTDPETVNRAVDAMNRQRGAGPFSVGWNWK